MRITWSDDALAQLERLADRAPRQARAIVSAMDWMAARDMGELGRLTRGRRRRYWAIPPHGVYYAVRDGELKVYSIQDARRRRKPFRLADVALTRTGYNVVPAR